MPELPFWQLVFINASVFFVGSDDIPAEAKIEATRAISQALEAGWQGLGIAERVPLDDIAQAHEFVEHSYEIRACDCNNLTLTEGRL